MFRVLKDMVDILVGWHLDHSQRETVIHFTSNALISFQSFWSTDVTFTFNLLSQFLEDMETHIIVSICHCFVVLIINHSSHFNMSIFGCDFCELVVPLLQFCQILNNKLIVIVFLTYISKIILHSFRLSRLRRKVVKMEAQLKILFSKWLPS